MNTTIQPSTQYKNSPLGLIPADWEVKSLGEVTTIKGDYGINAAAVDFDEQLPVYIRITDIDDEGYFTSEKKKSVNDINSSNFYLNKNDLVFVRTGATVGKSYLYNENDGKLVFAGFLIRFRVDTSKANDYFLWSFTKSKPYWDWVKSVSMRSGQPGINSTEYSSLKLPIPSLPEQKAIADCLSTWDKAIEKQNALIAQKELSKKALMQQLLSGKKRLKGFNGEWSEYHLKDMFSERNETGHLNLTLLSVGATGIYPQSEAIKKDSSNEDKSKYKRICVNDIGYNTMRMWQGRSALSSLEGIVSPAYTVLMPKENAFSLYFSYLFKTPKLVNLFWRNSQGLVDDTLNCKYKDFARVKYLLPEKEEQTAIANVLQSADDELQLLKKKLEQLREQKKGLMQVLLTGKKRLKY